MYEKCHKLRYAVQHNKEHGYSVTRRKDRAGGASPVFDDPKPWSGLARSPLSGRGQPPKSPRPNIGGLTFWLILVPAYGGGGAASTIVRVGERLRNPSTGLQTSPVR